ncbi:uncharacterized protein BDV17DRAFT_259007 [Aspergillus undulatus]|uniref:uncharacterized protein n=1 Tax=Aspergillus undulatus TaxID=1810928 RepID=UPI003CCD47D2
MNIELLTYRKSLRLQIGYKRRFRWMLLLPISEVSSSPMSSQAAQNTASTPSIDSSTIPARDHDQACSSQLIAPLSDSQSSEGAGNDQAQTSPRARTCASTLDDRNIQWKLFNLVLSTVLLLINLATYVSFVVIRAIRGPWLYIVLTFILLTLGVIWCHTLCRFIVAVYQFPNHAGNALPPLEMAGVAGYARPEQPIHVTMAGDEERFTRGRHAAAVRIAVPPPAYGVWRSSVRLNPDLLYWQRVDNQPPTDTDIESGEQSLRRKTSGRRPPTYMSDDGVEYVVEAQPRSFTEYTRR